MFPKLFLFFVFLLFFNLLKSQTLASFEDIIHEKMNVKNEIKTQKNHTSFFKIYKNYFSSQDGNGCSFYPSCSRFAVESIKAKGIFMGTLAAFDRLSRCNGHNHSFYLVHNNSQKQLDLPR